MADLASLQLEIDSRQAQEAKRALNDLASAADKAESATESLSQASQQSEDRYKAIARAALDRKAALDAEVQSQISAGEAGRVVTVAQREQAREYTRVATAERQASLENERHAAAQRLAAESAEKNRVALAALLREIDPLQGKLNRLDDMERQLTATFRQGAIDADSYGVALAKINAQRQQIGDQQMKMVAAGATEAASSMERLGLNTRAAQYDLMMLGRAAATGDLRQASSSMLQLATRTNIMGAAARVAINPLTLLAVAVGGVYLLYERHASQIAAYNMALIETGNVAGMTGEQLTAMAARVGDQAGSFGHAREALLGLIRTGKVWSTDIESASRSIASYSVATGQSVADLVSEYQDLARDPAQALFDLNEKHGYVTQAVYQHVKALQDQGRETEAVSAAMRAHSQMMDERAPQIVANLNIIQKAWRRAKSAAAEYFAIAAQGVHHALGGSRSSDEIRTELEGVLQKRDMEAAGVASNPVDEYIRWVKKGLFGKSGAQLADPATLAHLDGQIKQLFKELDTAMQRESSALIAGDQSRSRELGLAGESFLDGLVDRSKTDLAKAREIARLKKAATDAILGYENDPNITQQQREGGIAAVLEKERIALDEIEKRFKPQGSGRGGPDMSGYRRTLQALTDDFRNANQILESERRSGLVDEESYWQKKIDLINQNEQAQKAAMQAEIGRLAGVKNSAKQVADIEAQMAKVSKDAAKERIVALNSQEAAQNKMRAAVNSYIDALNELVRAEERAGQQRLEGMGLGPRARELQTALSAADAKFAQEQVRLARDASKMGAGEYQQKLAGLVAEHQKMRDVIVGNYQAIKKAEDSWLLGAAEGMNAYADSAMNVYQQSSEAFGRMFGELEDMLVEGSFNWKKFADSVIKEIMRIYIRSQILGPIAQMLGGGNLLSGLFGDGSVSIGPAVTLSANGNVFPSSPDLSALSGGIYNRPTAFRFAKGAGILGEAGSEAVLPLKRGPDGKLGVASQGGGGVTIIMNNNGTPQQIEGQPKVSRDQMGRAVIELMINDVRTNGKFTRALKGAMT